ncbi:MAG: serine/threonine protein kinase, partial [Thermoguttaceae bacterium]|nr:serine/threonine protein kinase [Thermoguttaceae bacterium]
MSDLFDERRADAPRPQNARSSQGDDAVSQTTQISQFFPTPAPRTPAPDAEEPDLETLSERFVEDFRAGRRPSVDEYAERFPEFAEEIRELFPALLLLEKGGAREALSSLSQGASRQGFAISGLDRLKNYRIVREIGRGGMGVVYEAWDETLERVVALKVMKIFPGEEAQAIKRFQREAKTAARLHHTNIVPVFDSDVLDDKFFYVMQLVDGVNLEQFLRMKEAEASETLDKSGSASRSRRSGSSAETTVPSAATRSEANVDSLAETTELPPSLASSRAETPEKSPIPSETNALSKPQNPEKPQNPGFFARRADAKRRRQDAVNPSAFGANFPAASKPLFSVRIAESNYYQRVCDVVVQAARGLDYAHRHDVVHRDIKPSNLVVDEDGVVWITDFGLAKSTTENDLTRQGQLVGTLRYLAPEALEGDFSPLSDVYSLGLTLYELLTFTPAFDETNYTKLLARVAEGRPVRPRKINPKIPLDLETIVLKAVEPAPEKRYASAGEFADDLQRFLDDRPIRARRVGPLERLWRWGKRNRLVAGLLISIFILVSIIFAGISNGYVKARTLVRAKEAESQRARANLDLALAAFDDVFASLGDAAAVDFDFLDDGGSFGTPTDDPSIPEKDARVLENLLAFYDGFVAENEENEPTLLLKSARARVRVGTIRKLLGRSRDSDAYPKALELYRRALDFADDETERSQIALEKANAVLAAYDSAPLARRLVEFLPLCDESLDELASIPDDSTLGDAARRASATLRFERAVLRVEAARFGDEKNDYVGFFETPRRAAPTPETIAAIAADLA